jgi:hypothetical protein
LIVGTRRLIQESAWPALGLLGGLIISLISFYLVLGVGAIEPGQQRYAMYVVAPSCLVFVLLGRSLAAAPWAPWQIGGGLGLCTLLLFSFLGHYLAPLMGSGGEQPYPLRTFHTGPVEPKQAAFEAITAASDEPIAVLAADWWSHWPIRYLAYDRPNLQVLLCRKPEGQSIDVTTSRRRFFVAFAGGTSEAWMREHAAQLPRTEMVDYSGRPVLYVWDLGTATELLPGVIEAAGNEPAD